MRVDGAHGAVTRGFAAAALAVMVTGATTIVAAPIGAAPADSGPSIAGPANSGVVVVSDPTPSEVVRDTGSWISHGYTLDLWSDGTGAFSVWRGAFDGTRVRLRLIPAPGAATVAEVTSVEVVGAGALGADEEPGVGGLVTIMFGDEVRNAHVEWSSGPRRLAADLCPATGLDAARMATLRCGA
ncbi:hypothetical protein [Rhodococcus sp. IEGM 1408]|uniref:hypothetical protein n=1 Tax=Rhodococcus sp. IEGM 1408 TaxID=3082220 RepID=UPI002952CA6A|nr:hypothetical protein [Rhodococcus sp. IEGM 1408]MDV8000795.1 hypothetical protein [Rhodococcus sp. IEGM 1408]